MKNGFFRRIFAALAIMLLASALMAGAVAMSGESENYPEVFEAALLTPAIIELKPGELTEADLSFGEQEYIFQPVASSVYDIYLFPVDGEAAEVRAELWQGDELAAEGSGMMQVICERLIAGETYGIRLYGSGKVRIEVARHALSRCFDQPMMLDAGGDNYSKAFARAGDVHWYGIEGKTELPIIIAGDPESENLMLSAHLFDASGNILAEAMETPGGAFILDFVPVPGESYRLRLSSSNGHDGLYNLMLRESGSLTEPESLIMSQDEIILEGRSSAWIDWKIQPENAGRLLFWESSDESVVRVSQTGRITGVNSGTAMVTAYGANGVFDECRVKVNHVQVEGVNLLAENIAMNVGDDISLECAVIPESASNGKFVFSAEPEGIVEIEEGGVLRAVGEGTAKITVRTEEGGFKDYANVSVSPAVKRYRALLVGEQNYASTVAAVRPGSANSVANIRSMLGMLSYEGAKFQVQTRLDASRDGVISAIRSAFAGATEQDVSLFYITCHGYYEDGVSHLQMFDGSVLTAVELERELRKVPGEVVVMIDCCGSGGAIGKASSPENLLDGILAVFTGNMGGPAFSGSKYKVLVSAALEQESYRISFNQEAVETDMATVFARALCEGLGWDIGSLSRSAMRADVNFDGKVTLNELFNYTSRRVMWYLEITGNLAGDPGAYVQNVKVYPEGDTTPLFERP